MFRDQGLGFRGSGWGKGNVGERMKFRGLRRPYWGLVGNEGIYDMS